MKRCSYPFIPPRPFCFVAGSLGQGRRHDRGSLRAAIGRGPRHIRARRGVLGHEATASGGREDRSQGACAYICYNSPAFTHRASLLFPPLVFTQMEALRDMAIFSLRVCRFSRINRL